MEPDPDNEEQLRTVKEALELTSVAMVERTGRKLIPPYDFEAWNEHAVAVLTALRDLATKP